MDCNRIQSEILESVIEPQAAAIQAMIDAHVRTCPACASFATRQARVDAGLRAALTAPTMTPRALAIVRERIRHNAASPWPDLLPDVVHFTSCGVMTVLSVVILPFDATAVLAVGAAATFVSHALLTAVHGSWDAAGEGF